MSNVDDLVAAFKALREGVGVTPDKMADYQGGHLLDLLGTPGDAEAGLQVVGGVVETMLEPAHSWASKDLGVKLNRRLIQRAVRVALAIGEDEDGMPLSTHGILVERRAWAVGEGDPTARDEDLYFKQAATRTLVRYEEGGFRVLARLIAARAENPSFQAAADERLAEAGQTAAFTPVDPIDLSAAVPQRSLEADNQDDAGHSPKEPATYALPTRAVNWDGFRSLIRGTGRLNTRSRLLVGAATIVGVSVALIASNVFSGSHRPTTSATPRAVVTNAPVSKLDNRRGWGPARQTYTMEHPASSPVLNSITDTPSWGDERNFLACHDLADNSPWGTELIEHPGHTYQCEAFYDNDVASNLAQWASPNSGENPLAMLHGTKIVLVIPPPNPNVGLEVNLSASNILPPAPSEVWDSCNFVGPDRIVLSYVAGSARMVTLHTPNDGVPLKDDAQFTTNTGALLGDNQDGNLGQYAGYIDFKVLVQAA